MIILGISYLCPMWDRRTGDRHMSGTHGNPWDILPMSHVESLGYPTYVPCGTVG